MATPAGILSYVVEVDTDRGTAALRRFDSSVRRQTTAQRQAQRTTSGLNRATGSLGRSLWTAAKYAGGAAAAYISIAQAKEAITVTSDLAKTTAGLNRNLGLTIKQGSQWGAVAKSRDIDTKALNMSFTTLSRRLTDARKGSESAVDSFKDVGLTQKDLSRTNGNFNAQLLQVADAFGQAEGGARRQQAAQKLLGRGYQTLLPLFSSGAKGLKEQLHWADEYGATLSGKTLKAQMDLVAAQRESKVAILGLQVAVGTALAPALERANKEFQKVTRIMGSDDLTNAEKFERVGRIIEKWADKAFDAFIGVLPKIAEEAGERAPQIAGALIDGFMDADAWGKLSLLGLFGGRLLGGSGIAAIGSRIGSGISRAASSRMATTIPRGLKFDSAPVQAAGTGFGNLFGGAAAIAIAANIIEGNDVDSFNKFLPDLTDSFAINSLELWAKRADELTSKQRDAFKQQVRAADQSREITHEAARGILADIRAIDQGLDKKQSAKGLADFFATDTRRARQALTEFDGHTDRTMTDVARSVKRGGEKGGDALKEFTRETSQTDRQGRRNVDHLRSGVSGSFSSMAANSVMAIAEMAGETNKTLKSLKVKSQVYTPKKLKTVANAVGNIFDHNQRGGIIGAQRGAAVVPGAGSGDKIPAMLEPGEVVINREAVKAMGGPRRVNAINQSIPRFAQGGFIHPSGTPGSAVVNASIADQVAAWLRRYGMTLTAGYDPGGGHVSPGHNVTGTALDTVPTAGWGTGPTQTFESGLRAAISAGKKVLYGSHGVGTPYPNHGYGNHAHTEWGSGGAVAKAASAKIARWILDGPNGPLKSGGQKAIDWARAGMMDLLQKSNASFAATDVGKLPKGSFSVEQMSALWSDVGGPGSQAHTAGAVGMAESRGNPQAVGPSTPYGQAKGLWQILGQVVPGNIFDPVVNAKNAVKKYSDAGGWSPWEVYTNGNYQQFLQEGGILGTSLGALGAKKGKRRKHALHELKDKIQGFGLHPAMRDNLQLLSGDAEKYAEWAANASGLNQDNPYSISQTGGLFNILSGDTVLSSFTSADAAFDAFSKLTDPLLGRFRGGTEADWLTKELEALFTLRDGLVKSFEEVDRKREAIAKVIERTEDERKKAKNALERTERQRETLQKRLKDAKKKPKENKQLIQRLEHDLDKNADEMGGYRRLYASLSTVLGESGGNGLYGQREKLNTTRGDILGSGGDLFRGLSSVQGIDGPMGILNQLPALGTLGGDIYQAQLSLAELGKKPSISVDSSSTSTAGVDSELASLLQEQLRLANQRFSVSQAQYDVLRNFPTAPYMGAFAEGGIALVGERGPELAHLPSGTRVHDAGDTASLMTPQVIINGDIINTPAGKDPVEVLIGDRRFKQAVRDVKASRSFGSAGRLV